MAIDKEASRRWRRRIRDVLNTEWDPTGGCPEDEYDGYAGKVAAMIRDGASDEQLVDYLRWGETIHMGLASRPDLDARLRKVVQQLRQIGNMS